MPKSKIIYLCDICHKYYDEYSDAVNCENKGLPVGDLQQKLLNTKNWRSNPV